MVSIACGLAVLAGVVWLALILGGVAPDMSPPAGGIVTQAHGSMCKLKAALGPGVDAVDQGWQAEEGWVWAGVAGEHCFCPSNLRSCVICACKGVVVLLGQGAYLCTRLTLGSMPWFSCLHTRVRVRWEGLSSSLTHDQHMYTSSAKLGSSAAAACLWLGRLTGLGAVTFPSMTMRLGLHAEAGMRRVVHLGTRVPLYEHLPSHGGVK